MDKLAEKSGFWKVTRLWWILLSFVFLINWMSLIIVGLEVRKKNWVFFGILYAIPVFIFMTLNGQIEGIIKNVVMSLFFFSWFATIIHSIAIRKEYLYLLANKGNEKATKYKNKFIVKNKQKQETFAQLSLNHKKIYNALLAEQKAIRERYDEINPLHQPNFIDIIVMVDHFIEQAEELMKKEVAIDKIIAGLNIKQVENRIEELNQKIKQSNKVELKNEYEEVLEKYKKQRQTYNDFTNKKKVINLKLESNLMKLKEIRYDFIKIDYVVDEKKPHFLFNKVDDISKEMDTYLDVMTETYNELNQNR